MYNFIIQEKKRKSFNSTDSLKITKKGKIVFSSEFLEREDIKFCNYVSVYFDPEKRLLGLVFHTLSVENGYKLNRKMKRFDILPTLRRYDIKFKEGCYTWDKVNSNDTNYYTIKF